MLGMYGVSSLDKLGKLVSKFTSGSQIKVYVLPFEDNPKPSIRKMWKHFKITEMCTKTQIKMDFGHFIISIQIVLVIGN